MGVYTSAWVTIQHDTSSDFSQKYKKAESNLITIEFFQSVSGTQSFAFGPLYDPRTANRTWHQRFRLRTCIFTSLQDISFQSGSHFTATTDPMSVPFEASYQTSACSCHEPHSAYRSAFNMPYMCMPIHALCGSINNYRHSLMMQQRADAFPGRCIKQDWSLCVPWHLRGI